MDQVAEQRGLARPAGWSQLTPEERKARRVRRAAEQKAKRQAEHTGKADRKVAKVQKLGATAKAADIRERVAATEPTPDEVAAVAALGREAQAGGRLQEAYRPQGEGCGLRVRGG